VSIPVMEVKRFHGGIHRWKGTCLKIEFSKEAFTHGFRVGNLYQVVGSPLGTMLVDT